MVDGTGSPVDQNIGDLLPHLVADDILIDGGNSYYVDDIRRAKELAPKKIHYVDVGASGGIWAFNVRLRLDISTSLTAPISIHR